MQPLKMVFYWAQWHMPVILTQGKLRIIPRNHTKFDASLNSITKSFLKIRKIKNIFLKIVAS